jgi:hypothetical protein
MIGDVCSLGGDNGLSLGVSNGDEGEPSVLTSNGGVVGGCGVRIGGGATGSGCGGSALSIAAATRCCWRRCSVLVHNRLYQQSTFLHLLRQGCIDMLSL